MGFIVFLLFITSKHNMIIFLKIVMQGELYLNYTMYKYVIVIYIFKF